MYASVRNKTNDINGIKVYQYYNHVEIVFIKFKQLKPYYAVYKNWPYVLYNIYKKKETIRIKLRSGEIKYLNLNDIFDYTFKNYYRLSNGYIKFKNLRFKVNDGNAHLYNGDIGAVFIKEDYKWLRPKNCIAIDMGANIGDSSIYFALNGAKKVIALEPYPYSYRLAKENILNNGYKDKIVLLNAGYGPDGSMNVEDKITDTGNELTQADHGMRIKIFSLKTLLNDYKIDDAILKMDCEGCEYNLLNENNDTLRKFNRIQIEYHYGYEKLKNKLESAGFHVKYTDPVIGANNKNMHMGYLYAIKH